MRLIYDIETFEKLSATTMSMLPFQLRLSD
jgi:hypothetical protein